MGMRLWIRRWVSGGTGFERGRLRRGVAFQFVLKHSVALLYLVFAFAYS